MTGCLPHRAPEVAKLAIVGASGRAAAQSALRAGLRPAVADLFADADLQSICPAWEAKDYPRDLEAWLAADDCDAWMYVGGLENYPRLVDRMASIRPLAGNRGAALRRVRSPWRLAAAWKRRGLGFPAIAPDAPMANSPTPFSHAVLSQAEFSQAAHAAGWLSKPLRGSGGGGIVWAGSESPGKRRRMRQQYIVGESASALYVANGRRAQLWAFTEQLVGEAWTGARGFQYCGSLGPCTPSPQVERQLVAIGDAAVDEFGLVGAFGVDVAVVGERVWTIEINPRYTASAEIVERAFQASLVAWHLSSCLAGELPDVALATMVDRRPPCCGKAILYAKERLHIDAKLAQKLYAASLRPDLLQPPDVLQCADVPPAGTTVEPGRPVLTVLASGVDCEATRAQLRASMGAFRRWLGDAPLDDEFPR